MAYLCFSDGALVFANIGDNVTLPCFYASGAKYLCWYKQVAGQQPQIISSSYIHLPESNSFHNQFKNNNRLSVHAGTSFYHLSISNVQDSDSAMYYCGQTTITVTEFNNGTFLLLKGNLHMILKKNFCIQFFSKLLTPYLYIFQNLVADLSSSSRHLILCSQETLLH